MMARSIVIALLATACGHINTVNVAPPRAPHAFLTSVDAHDTEVQRPPVEKVTNDNEVWWTAFADPALDAAIQEAYHNNYLIRDTRGLIYENLLDPNLPQGWWYPLQVGILAPAGIQHLIVNLIPPPGIPLSYNAANIDLTANYQLDVFGNLAAQRRVGENFSEQQRQLVEARVQDTAVQVAQIWFDILETRALRELTLTQIKYNQDLYDLVKARFEQHLTTRLVVLQQEQLLLNLQSQVPLITTKIALYNSQLKLLLGRTPTPLDDLVPADHQLPTLMPPQPNVGTPADLNANAPEMRYAKLRVEEIEDRIIQNRSGYLPTINLTGSIGVSTLAAHGSDLGTNSPAYKESTIGVTLTWPIFDGKRITETKQLPMTLHRRELQYELAIKTTVGRVQDAVIQENNQATSLTNLRAQVELGQKVLTEARRLFEQGQSDYLPVLTALNNLTDLERASLLAQRLLINDRVELYRSLGGNWSYNVTTLQER
jgi:outer membrane protein TolC